MLDSFWDSINLIRELGVITFLKVKRFLRFYLFYTKAHVESVSCESFAHGLPAYYILALSEASRYEIIVQF